jgi:hypothetical protein
MFIDAVHRLTVGRPLNAKSVPQSYVSYFFTKIHGVKPQMTGNSTRLNVCIVENY